MPDRVLMGWYAETIRMDAADQLRAAQAASVPYMDADNRAEYMAQLRWAASTQAQRDEDERRRKAEVDANWAAFRGKKKIK